MIVAITGASGHLGAAVCRSLLEKGHTVRALVYHDDRALQGLPVELVRGSVLDPATPDQLTRGAEVVQHLAAVISVHGDPEGKVMRTNIEGTRNIVDACLRNGVRRLVHFSSVHALAVPPFDQVMDETCGPARPDAFHYERSKSTGHQLVLDAVREHGLDAVILLPSSVLGPWDFKPSLQGTTLLDMYHRRYPVLPNGGFDWVDNRDIAEVACAAMEKGEKGEAYLVAGHYATLAELSTLVGAATGRRLFCMTIPVGLLKTFLPVVYLWSRITGTQPVMTRESIAHIEAGHPGISWQKAARTFGYAPRPLAETVADTMNWLINK